MLVVTEDGVKDKKKDPCRLFTLPGELRNRIYRCALLSSEKVVVNSQSFAQPSLLETCTKVRREASSIYYLANDFLIEVPDFDSNALTSWYGHAFHYRPFSPDSHLQTTGRHRWANLVTWLKRCHTKGTIVLDLRKPQYDNPWRNVAARMFGAVQKFKDLPWERLGDMLESFHLALEETGNFVSCWE